MSISIFKLCKNTERDYIQSIISYCLYQHRYKVSSNSYPMVVLIFTLKINISILDTS